MTGQIDNEYLERDWAYGGDEYLQHLKEAYHDAGIVVPLTYNDPSQHKTFVNGTVRIQVSKEMSLRLTGNRVQRTSMGTTILSTAQ
jgi:hypothetical protein